MTMHTKLGGLVLALATAAALSHSLLSAAPVPATVPVAPTQPLLKSVVRVGMTVSDLDRSVAFFHDVLDFQKVSEREVAGKAYEQETGVFGLRCRIADLQLGEETLELTEYVASPGRGYPPDSRSNDRWFQHVAIITSDMEAAYKRLREKRVKFASTGPQTLPAWNKNAAGIKAFYFKDPDGHVLETLQFPAGKGEARWKAKGAMFLGIDHTAIVVKETEKSLAFYRDACGMKVVGGSENYGEEQEHLNNVEGARLRITTLRAEKGPAVELLEYLNPRDGRAYPADERPNDLVHWQTTVRVEDVPAAFARFAGAGRGALSEEPVELGSGKVFLARDPDGHVLQVLK